MIPKTINLSYTAEDGTTHSREYTDLSQVWHDASEGPTDNLAQIIYQDNFDNCWLTTKHDSLILDGDLKRFAALNLMIRWAYIRDLLPKLFGIPEQLKKDKEKKN